MTDDLKSQGGSVVEPDSQYVLVPTWVEFKDFMQLFFLFFNKQNPAKSFYFIVNVNMLA